MLYTLGQRRGLNIGGGLPYYVISKDVVQNEVYVTRNLNHPNLWSQHLKLQRTHWLSQPSQKKVYDLRTRHGGALQKARLSQIDQEQGLAICDLLQPIRAPAAGQSAVFYDGSLVIGGGIICQE